MNELPLNDDPDTPLVFRTLKHFLFYTVEAAYTAVWIIIWLRLYTHFSGL